MWCGVASQLNLMSVVSRKSFLIFVSWFHNVESLFHSCRAIERIICTVGTITLRSMTTSIWRDICSVRRGQITCCSVGLVRAALRDHPSRWTELISAAAVDWQDTLNCTSRRHKFDRRGRRTQPYTLHAVSLNYAWVTYVPCGVAPIEFYHAILSIRMSVILVHCV